MKQVNWNEKVNTQAFSSFSLITCIVDQDIDAFELLLEMLAEGHQAFLVGRIELMVSYANCRVTQQLQARLRAISKKFHSVTVLALGLEIATECGPAFLLMKLQQLCADAAAARK